MAFSQDPSGTYAQRPVVHSQRILAILRILAYPLVIASFFCYLWLTVTMIRDMKKKLFDLWYRWLIITGIAGCCAILIVEVCWFTTYLGDVDYIIYNLLHGSASHDPAGTNLHLPDCASPAESLAKKPALPKPEKHRSGTGCLFRWYQNPLIERRLPQKAYQPSYMLFCGSSLFFCRFLFYFSEGFQGGPGVFTSSLFPAAADLPAAVRFSSPSPGSQTEAFYCLFISSLPIYSPRIPSIRKVIPKKYQHGAHQ